MDTFNMFVVVAVMYVFLTKKHCVSEASCKYGKDDAESQGNQHCIKDNHIGISENERRILLIGKTGVGKSTSGNVILDKNIFPAGDSFTSITLETKLGRAKRFGKNLVVIDTPGLFDAQKNNSEVMIEIAKCYAITSPGLHAIILVVPVGRFTNDEKATVEYFVERFGKGLIKYLGIIFTGKDRIERNGQTIEGIINNIPEGHDLKRLLRKIDYRYVAFGNNGKTEDRDKEVKELLNMVDDIVVNNGGGFYTNEMYEEAEKILNERWEEEKRREKQKHDAEIETTIKSVKEQYQHEQNKLSEEIHRIKLKHKEYIERKDKEMFQRETEFKNEMQRQARRRKKKGGFLRKVVRGVKKLIRF